MSVSYALFVPHYSEAVFAFLNVIEALKQTCIKPLVLVSADDAQTQQVCADHDIATEIMPAFAWHHQLKNPYECLAEPLRVRRFCEQLLQRYSIAAIVLVDDRRYNELFLIRAARRRNILTLVLMWAATNTSEDMMKWRQKSLAHLETSRWRWLKPLVRLFAPRALRVIDGHEVIWQHPLAVLTLALFTGYPPQPWIFGGGTADKVAVMGEHYRDLLLKEGVPAEKVMVTGHPRHDDIVHLRAQWQDNPPEKPYILLAAPPIAHIKKGTRAGHVSPEEMSAYLHWVIEQLLTLPYEVMVKPHPRDVDAELAYLDGHTRDVQVVRDAPIAPLIARAMLLVCQGSSVVLDACGLDVPVVTFDFYQTPGYDMWQHFGAVIHVTEREQFAKTVRDVLSDAELGAQLREQRKAFVARYMRLDGQVTARLVALIQQSNDRSSHEL